MALNKFGLLFGFLFLLFGCNNKNKIESKILKNTVKYSNGNIYIEGFNSVNKENGVPINRVGIWRYYYPNSTLKMIYEYDQNGNELNYKRFSDAGILLHSEVLSDNVTSTTYYYENGKIQYESVSRVEMDSNEDGEEETTYFTTKSYYENGQLEEQTSYVDNVIDGENKIWDKNGNLILSVLYENGLIIKG